MNFIDIALVLLASTLVAYNYLLLQRVLNIYRHKPALFNYSTLIVLSAVLLFLALTLLLIVALVWF